jgi:hypothetical protein
MLSRPSLCPRHDDGGLQQPLGRARRGPPSGVAAGDEGQHRALDVFGFAASSHAPVTDAARGGEIRRPIGTAEHEGEHVIDVQREAVVLEQTLSWLLIRPALPRAHLRCWRDLASG